MSIPFVVSSSFTAARQAESASQVVVQPAWIAESLGQAARWHRTTHPVSFGGYPDKEAR
jgi:hypothetical protein